ncbi:unnamed protein product [Brassica oleracea var. botrytis]|nr:unnamed protein product [Brassica napus]VDD21809.1 unnamed protein product [Brassica oleracea]
MSKTLNRPFRLRRRRALLQQHLQLPRHKLWVGHRLDHSGRTQWLLLNLRNKVVVIIITQETEGEAKSGAEPCLYVKVSMEGAPYLRKIDLKTYKSYVELSSALEEMFSCFTTGQFGSHGGCGRDGLNESRLTDLLRGSEYVVTYEDKDSVWMLVGDVPWETFICSCKKLRIMKSSEAIGLAPRVMEKCRSRN